MRAAFTFLILCVSAFYTYAAFADLSFLSSTGRLGPGFFPRIIGAGLIIACLFDLAVTLKRHDEPPIAREHLGTVLFLGGATFLFILSMEVLGGYAAMVGFLLLTFFVLNPGRWIQNIATSLALPIVIYLIFEVWLNAAIPRGYLDAWLA